MLLVESYDRGVEMRIEDAIKHSCSVADNLSGKDKVAVLCLIEIARRVAKARKPLKDLMESLGVDLNQESMFGE